MTLDYSKRELWSVTVHGFQAAEISDTDAASTAVTIWLAAEDNPDLPGPKIELEFAFPAESCKAKL